jgi:hypothetical protein
MTWPALLAILTALYQLYFAVFHLRFWQRHRLDFDLRHASEFIRKIFRILSTVLAVQLTANAITLLWLRESLAQSPAGIAVLLQITAFWSARLVLHWIYFPAPQARWLSLFALGIALPLSTLLAA